MRIALPLLFVTLTACDDFIMEPAPADGCTPGFVEEDGACVFDEMAVAELMRTFEQGELEKVNVASFTQIMGPPLERNVWVTPLPVEGTDLTAADLYQLVVPFDDARLPAAFPVGTLIIHETVDRSEGHTVQVKLDDDYDDGAGRSWWTGKYYDDGEPDLNDCTPCIACHNMDARPESEGLIGLPDDAR